MKTHAISLLTAALLAGPLSSANFIKTYTQASSDLSPNSEILFADFAAGGGNDLVFNDGNASSHLWEIQSGGAWNIGEVVTITGIAIPIWANDPNTDGTNNTQNGTSTFTFRSLGANDDYDTGDTATFGTATAEFVSAGLGVDTYYVNFDTPVTWEADSNGFGITMTHSAAIRLKTGPAGTGVEAENSSNGATRTGYLMSLSVAGTVSAPIDTDNDGLPDLVETGGLFANGDPLGPYGGPLDTGTWADVDDSDGDGIKDGDEVNGEPFSGMAYTSDPTNANSDADGINDGDEVNGTLNTAWFNDPTDPTDEDTDNDNISDADEINITGTNPATADTDNDGLDDDLEDANQDGVLDPGETSPLFESTDGDSLPDSWEIANGLDPRDDGSTLTENGDNGDPDSDLLPNIDEYNAGINSSDPNLADTDRDGLDDKEEFDLFLLPNNRDTDGDGLSDKFEVDNALDAFSNADFDNDTFSDRLEVLFYGTDPKLNTSFPGDGTTPAPGNFTPIQDAGFGALDAPATLGSTIIDEADAGGADFDFFNGRTTFTTVYSNAFPSAGTTVSLTGFAWVVTGAVNASGDILLEFYDPGVDGIFDGIDQDTLLGTAKGTLTVTGSTTVMYWNFDTPIDFVSEGTALGVKISSTAALRIKAQDNVASGFWQQDDGSGAFGNIRASRFSIGGTAIAPNGPKIETITRNGTTTNLTWTLGSATTVTLERSTDLGITDPWNAVLEDTTDTTYEETSSDDRVFFRLVSP